jgi:DNA polymerase-1
MARLLIVDGHAYAYRAFHAIRELRSPTGQPTNAIYGFIKMLAKMRATLSPTHLIVVWDGGLCAERMTALPEYKAHRPEMPADLRPQIDEIVRYLEAANIASFCRDGVEADDYIACLARRAFNADMEVVIASSDKDFMQLVTSEPKTESRKQKAEIPAPISAFPILAFCFSPHIGLLNPNDKTETVWTAEQVRAKAGVEPGQIVDWLSLIGDSVDNIPGVPGVGPKTAADLLHQFGSVAALYGRLPEVKSERLRAALTAAADAVRRNQELVRLREDLPCEFSPQEMADQPADADRLGPLFRQWNFRSLLAELEASREVGDTGQVTRDTTLPKASCHVSPVTCHPTQAVLL